jgi:hypothetical protein
MSMKEVTQEQFFKTIGPLNVHPHPVGNYPYTSIFLTPGRVEMGRIVDQSSGPSKYFLAEAESHE